MAEYPKPLFAVIGGSGVYDMDAMRTRRWVRVETPFGAPSDELLFGEIGGETIVFLPRHGRGHKIPPGEINFRANLYALKKVGVNSVVSVTAVGSLREHLHPGDFVIVDQFVDRTFARVKSFFGTGLAAHVSMAHPVCARLGDALAAAARPVGVKVERGGTYLVMEGPQFSSVAESNLYRMWGCDVIGMTNMPEAKLAREAEMCYATVAMVTDYDCWHPGHDNVTVEQVVNVLKENARHARGLVENLVPVLKESAEGCPHGCQTALDHAIITAPEARCPEMLKKLDVIVARVQRKKG